MCGIALTLAYQPRQTDANGSNNEPARLQPDDKHSHSRSVTLAAARWSRIAQRCLRARGPDVQHSMPLGLDHLTAGAAPAAAAVLTGAVLHLRGASSTPTAQPLEAGDGSGNTLCWNGELYALDHSRLSDELQHMALPQIEAGQNDTAFVLALLCALSDLDDAPSTAGHGSISGVGGVECDDRFGARLSSLLAAMDGPFSFVFFRRARGQLWYGRDRLGRRSLVVAQRTTHCGPSDPAPMSLLHVCSVTLPESETGSETGFILEGQDGATADHGAADDSDPTDCRFGPALWEEVGTTGVWCIQLHGSSPGIDTAASASVSASATSASACSAHATSSAPDCEPSSAAPSVAAAAGPSPGAPFTLLHYPWPHVQATLGAGSQTEVEAEMEVEVGGRENARAGGPHRPLARLAHSFATGVLLDKEVAPYERDPATQDASSLDEQLRRVDAEAAALAPTIPREFSSLPPAAQLLYSALERSLRLRLLSLCTPAHPSHARIGILFSGGLDCMVLAALAHRILPRGEPVDLINVAFCGELKKKYVEKYVPDRVTSINGWRELRAMAERDAREDQTAAAATSSSSLSSASPRTRQWNLIHVNVSLRMLERHRAHILSLLRPSATVMDFNIAAILWFGARARGVLYGDHKGNGAAVHAHNQSSDAPSSSLSPDGLSATSGASSIDMIQSRLSRLGRADAVPTFDAEPLTQQQLTAARKAKTKGRVLPPELIAKIAETQTSMAFQYTQAKLASATAAASATSSVGTQLSGSASQADADSSAASTGPVPSALTADEEEAVATAAESSVSSPPSTDPPAPRLTKAERRSQKHRERNMIRRYFRAETARATQADIDEMLPAREDFMSPLAEEQQQEDADVEYDDYEATMQRQHACSLSAASGPATSSAAAASSPSPSPSPSPFYTSHAKVLLLGIGADELMAGYGRHRTVWAAAGGTGKRARKERGAAKGPPQDAGATATAAPTVDASSASAAGGVVAPAPVPSSDGWSALRDELSKDFSRLWRRNLGRDDRVIGDSGREARHPFLDESLLALLHERIPLRSVADLSLPPGVGDKQILRQVALACGLDQSGRLVKRAMQFGSRIANKKVAGYVAMHPGVRCRDIVNPFFLRAEAGDADTLAPLGDAGSPSVPSGAGVSAAATAVPYVRAAPEARLDKRVQKAQRKAAAAAAPAASLSAPVGSSVAPAATESSATVAAAPAASLV